MKRSKKVMDNAVAQLKALLPALEQFLNEEATEPAHQEGATDPEAAAAAATTADPAAQAQAVQTAEGDTDPTAAIEAPATEAGAANPAAGATTDPAVGGEQVSAESTDLPALVAEVEAVLGKLKAAMAGASNEGGNDDPTQAEGAATSGEGAAADPATAAAGEDDLDPGTEGLNATVKPGTGEDAAIRRFYGDLAAKNRLYDRLSPVVGAFDHAAMDAAGVARYGVKKLDISCSKGTEAVALDAYLSGREKHARENKAAVTAASSSTTRVGDSAASAVDEVDAYLKG